MSIIFRWLILFALAISATMLHAQEKVILTGQTKDASKKEPLEFCTITVLNSEDSLITGTVTDQNGYFSVSVFVNYLTDYQ